MLFLIKHPIKGCQKLFVMKSTDRKRSKMVVLMQYATFEIPAVAEWYASVGGRVKNHGDFKGPETGFSVEKGAFVRVGEGVCQMDRTTLVLQKQNHILHDCSAAFHAVGSVVGLVLG